ncbi:MAG TPA: hypothetical protein VF615_28545 [Longimicrobiaceae bacterium]|jgi:hypothetical protein
MDNPLAGALITPRPSADETGSWPRAESATPTARRRRSFAPSVPDLIGASVLAGVLLGKRPEVLNGDTAAHLRMGELILDSGSIPRTETLSFTMLGRHLALPGWLGEVAFAAAERLGGLGMVAALAAGLAVLAAVLPALLLRRRGADPRITLLAVALGASLSASGWTARPHLWSYVGVGLVLGMLERRRPVPLAGVALLFAAWANLHAGFVYGLALLGLYALGTWVEERGAEYPRGGAGGGARRLLAATAVACAASLLNPAGPGIVRQIAGALGSDAVAAQTTEWAPPSFGEPRGVFLAAVVLAAAAVVLLSRRRPAWSRALAVAAFLLAALQSSRHVPLFGLVAVPLVALHASESFRRTSTRYWFGDAFAEIERRTVPGAWILPLFLGFAWLSARPGAWGFDPSQYPVAAVQAARSAGLQGRIFHSLQWGGFIAYAWPERKVFFHPVKYDDDVSAAYLGVVAGPSPPAARLEQLGIDLVVAEPGSRLARELVAAPGWTVWHRDGTAVVLRRSTGPRLPP